MIVPEKEKYPANCGSVLKNKCIYILSMFLKYFFLKFCIVHKINSIKYTFLTWMVLGEIFLTSWMVFQKILLDLPRLSLKVNNFYEKWVLEALKTPTIENKSTFIALTFQFPNYWWKGHWKYFIKSCLLLKKKKKKICRLRLFP